MRMHEVRPKKSGNIIQINIDLSSVPSQDRKYSRLRNKSKKFEDRRFKKPRYKTNYMED